MYSKKNKKLDGLVDDIVKYAELVKRHLNPCSDDLSLLTLKGHLVVENLVEINLLHVLAIERLPEKDGQLGFNQKLKLLKIVVEQREPGPNADLFCAIDKLNWLRNQLAHNLKDASQIEKDVMTFVKEYQVRSGTKAANTSPLPAQLRGCILKLCKFLYEIRDHFHQLEK